MARKSPKQVKPRFGESGRIAAWKAGEFEFIHAANAPPAPESKTDVWWQVFEEARDLRARYAEIAAKCKREELRGQLAAIKCEAFDLLGLADIPSTLRNLIVDLWGGARASFLPGPNRAFHAAARLEAQHPRIGKKKLAALLRAELKTSTDYTRQIGIWRRKPLYRRLVAWERGEPI